MERKKLELHVFEIMQVLKLVSSSLMPHSFLRAAIHFDRVAQLIQHPVHDEESLLDLGHGSCRCRSIAELATGTSLIIFTTRHHGVKPSYHQQ